MWDLIVSVPDHCLSFYFSLNSFCRVNSYNDDADKLILKCFKLQPSRSYMIKDKTQQLCFSLNAVPKTR